MTETEQIGRWVQAWKEAGPELEQIRLREIRSEDTVESLRQLARAFNQATRNAALTETSGLVEMQRYFAKLRK